ncbi:MAG: hypothetical protein QXU98_09960 [Candidatus Parvarchaeota archaeon]
MRGELANLNLKDLFKRLSSAIKSFAASIEETIAVHERQAPESEIRELIEHIKLRAKVDEKEAGEDAEILGMLRQLIADKQIFSLIKIEVDEWLELLDVLEERIESRGGPYGSDERQLYEEIKETSDKLRRMLRGETDQ